VGGGIATETAVVFHFIAESGFHAGGFDTEIFEGGVFFQDDAVAAVGLLLDEFHGRKSEEGPVAEATLGNEEK
jgi:hypothetical protein